MTGKYNTYDISCKISYVEEYLELTKRKKMTITDYAKAKNLATSTFSDWLSKYKKDKDTIINEDNNTDLVDLNKGSSFIELSPNNLASPVIVTNETSDIKMMYKDVMFEFGYDKFEYIIEMIRRW